MEVSVLICEQCLEQGKLRPYLVAPMLRNIWGHKYVCPKDSNHKLREHKFYGNVKVDKPKHPHIEKGTLVRVWDINSDNSLIRKFVRFANNHVVTTNLEGSESNWKYYEFIPQDEVNPSKKK